MHWLAAVFSTRSLHWQIKQDTGIDVELRFSSIVDKGTSWTDRTIPPTKAIHLDVDQNTLPWQLKRLEKTYSAGAKLFPLGIKMRLVRTGTGFTAGKLIKLQARFLKYTETRWLSIDSQELKTQQCPLYDILRALTLPSGQANQLRKPLFHAVSPSRTNDGYLV